MKRPALWVMLALATAGAQAQECQAPAEAIVAAPSPSAGLAPAGVKALEAIARARLEPAATAALNPDSGALAGTLWMNLADPYLEYALQEAIDESAGRRVEIHLVAFGSDPAIEARSVLFHMLVEKDRLGMEPARLKQAAVEFRDTDYVTLHERYARLPACSRVAAALRVRADTEGARSALKRMNQSIYRDKEAS